MPRPQLSKKELRERKKAREDRAHERYVMKTYGLEQGDYHNLLMAQDGRCAICTKIPRNRRLAVDHDHTTGQVRGLLCYFCNKFLGQWEFDGVAAHNAAIYLANIAATHGPEYDPRFVLEPRPPRRPLRVPAINGTTQTALEKATD